MVAVEVEGVVELVMGRGGGREGVEGRWRS